MLLQTLILIPLFGIFTILTGKFKTSDIKIIALFTSILNLIISLFIYILFVIQFYGLRIITMFASYVCVVDRLFGCCRVI